MASACIGEGNQGPPAADWLHGNTCCTLRCSNYEKVSLVRAGRGANAKIVDDYLSVGVRKGVSALGCKRRQEIFGTKSNLAVMEERCRLRDQSKPNYRIDCVTVACVHFGKQETSHPSFYQLFGRSTAGSQRIRGKTCRKTFTVATRASLRQRLPAKTAFIFSLLINKSPMRRICEVSEINPAVNQLTRFIHQQCFRVAVEMQSGLSALSSRRLGTAVDRQDHVLNWSSQFDRGGTQLGTVASADAASGYGIGIHLDYDPRYDVHDLGLAAQEGGERIAQGVVSCPRIGVEDRPDRGH